jgi:uncharacterized YigZ family protein
MTLNQEKYKTIVSPSTSLFKDKGSKFFGFSFPINSSEEVKSIINELKKEHSKATHYCFAYRMGNDGISFRTNDDGEPNGSAGRPILGQIDSAGFTNILIVVIRYYGGTMLGMPGLINAYKTAAMEAINAAESIEKWICQRVEIELDYNKISEVLYLLKQAEAQIIRQDLQLFCTIIADIPKVHFANIIAQLQKNSGIIVKPIAF